MADGDSNEVQLNEFQHAALKVFPPLLVELHKSLGDESKHIPMKKIKKFPAKGDYKGLYVLIEKNTPIYVGIAGSKTTTRGVIKRVKQHISEPIKNNTNKASFAVRLAKEKLGPDFMLYKNDTKDHNSNWHEFEPYFKNAVNRIKEMNVCLFNASKLEDWLLYLFEVYVSLDLKTPYNEFKNH